MNKARNCVIPARHIPKSSSEWVKNGQLTTFFKEYLRKNLILIYETFLDLFSAVDSETTEPNFYHGLSGIAVMHYKMGTAFPRQQHRYWDRALDSIKRALNILESRRKNPTTDSSLFYGAAGVYFVAAKIYRKTGYYKLAQAMTSQFLETVDLEKDSPASRLELDSGLSGYALGCIQLLNLWRDDHHVRTQLVEKIDHIKNILEIRVMEHLTDKPSPSMGQKHGVAGVLHVLSLLSNDEVLFLDHINSVLDSAKHSTSDSWCNGTSGHVQLSAEIYRKTGSPHFLYRATDLASTIWLREEKRPSDCLCHGAVASAYAFLEVYRLTLDEKYLWQACILAEQCTLYDIRAPSLSVAPCSLFTGLGGTVYFLADLLAKEKNARMPIYDF